MAAPTDRELLERNRADYHEHGDLSPETKLLNAIFGYEVSRGGELYEERYDYSKHPAGFPFRRYVGRVC